MKIDALVAEIGSTTTVVNAFNNLETDNPKFIGQGLAPTSINLGDINIGLNKAIKDLSNKLQDVVEPSHTFASSSAAGGLKMSVHGLVYDMTVKAAKEAALGAGAIIKMITAGILTDDHLETIKKANLNIILVAGGVDYGEGETALTNASKLAQLKLSIPIIYAGNIINHSKVKDIFKEKGQEDYLFITENVYPKIDKINIEPVRKVIHQVFEKHIIYAPGMDKIRNVITSNIIPTPGAVYEACLLLQGSIGNLVCVDVGGATTDVVSIGENNQIDINISVTPEPFAKRTVEGDLGVYVNRNILIDEIGFQQLKKDLHMTDEELLQVISNYQPIPTEAQVPLTRRLTFEAIKIAVKRHAGFVHNSYFGNGNTRIIEGKDLTNFNNFIATGGALTKLPDTEKLIKNYLMLTDMRSLKPQQKANIWIDREYIFASLGVLSKTYPQAAIKLMKKSIGFKEESCILD